MTYNKISDSYGHVPKETVLQAVEDKANGNRPILSTGVLQRRIAEVQHDRYLEHQQFVEFFANKYMRVKE